MYIHNSIFLNSSQVITYIFVFREANVASLFILKGAEVMQEIQDLKQEIQQIKSDQKDMQRDIRNLETRTTVNEKDIVNINKLLDKISANTTWILRLIVGGLVGAALTFLLKGGGM